MAEGLITWYGELDTFRTSKTAHAIIYKSLFGWYLNIDIESLGDWSDRGTPGHIPNPIVKPVSADGTWWVTAWESRSLPRDFIVLNPPMLQLKNAGSNIAHSNVFKALFSRI
jgi:hypothetical protein